MLDSGFSLHRAKIKALQVLQNRALLKVLLYRLTRSFSRTYWLGSVSLSLSSGPTGRGRQTDTKIISIIR